MINIKTLKSISERVVKASTYPVLGKYWVRKDEVSRSRKLIELAPYLSQEEGNKKIGDFIQDNRPAMVARFGATELDAMLRYDLLDTLGVSERLIIQVLQKFHIVSMMDITRLSTKSGFFPINEKTLDKFQELMKESIGEVDVLASWLKGESFYQENLKNAQICELRTIEPYYHDDPWSKKLEGQRVLVIHPFAETIISQYKNRRASIFANKNILPSFDLVCIKSVQSLAGNETGFDTWFDALEYMSDEIRKIDFDVAILGCGAYGFPLAARVKRLGKIAVHLGGATQILFGIKGARWDAHPIISKLYNQYWVRPSDLETPNNAHLIENGCYW